MTNDLVWPDGATYVFQGTIAEDATAGTHVCSLTVTPGIGNEMQLLYGQIKVGNTATSQTSNVLVNDGTNTISVLVASTGTTASLQHNFPSTGVSGNASFFANSYAPMIISGTMNLVLQVTTAAVSVTQTFAVACRIRGTKPTAVLNDTIGTSTNATNTDAVFG